MSSAHVAHLAGLKLPKGVMALRVVCALLFIALVAVLWLVHRRLPLPSSDRRVFPGTMPFSILPVDGSPFAMYDRAGVPLRSLAYSQRLELANLVMQHMYRPAQDAVLAHLQQRTGLPFTQRRNQSLYSKDAFELLRYRIPSRPNWTTLASLQVAAEEARNSKGFELHYRYKYDVTSRFDESASWGTNLLANVARHNLSVTEDEAAHSTGTLFVYNHSFHNACFLRNISLKYMPQCPFDAQLPVTWVRPLLVTAVQRSGTHYTWEMLNRLGVRVHHEGVGDSGAVSWLYAINAHGRLAWEAARTIDLASSYIINNPQRHSAHRFRFVFHQVRHPLRVVATMVNKCAPFDRIWQWIAQLPGLGGNIAEQQSPLRRAMLLYLLWNRHIELYADARFVAETTSVRDVCRWAGFPDTFCSAPMRAVNDTVRTVAAGRVPPAAAQDRHQDRSRGPHRRLRNGVPSIRGASVPAPVTPRLTPDHELGADAFNRAPPRSFRGSRLPRGIPTGGELKVVTWADLDREDRLLADEIRLLCLEYGLPLDPAEVPQSPQSRVFHA